MPNTDVVSFSRVARARIAANGIRGLSLRSVAQDVGSSLGSLSYRIGDKAALIARLIEEEEEERRHMAMIWQARTAYLDLAAPDVLATVITAWLDEAATIRREAALAGCELLLEAGIDPDGFPGLGRLLDEEDAFWIALLRRNHGDDAGTFGRVIAGYCRDELPFSIAAGNNTDYRLLRSATVARLAARFAGCGADLAAQFDRLVDACGLPRDGAVLPVELPEGSKKAELAGQIAALIVEQGVAGVTHRVVAARAGVSNSSVAHHFRTRDDLLRGGMGALILGMRRELRSDTALDNSALDNSRHQGLALIRATHAIALAAARDPDFALFALDMRRRRAENVRADIGAQIGGAQGLDGAATQAAVIAMIGAAFAARARGEGGSGHAVTTAQLAALRNR